MGLEEKEKRDKEVAKFREAHKEAILENQKLSVEKVKEYEGERRKVRCVLWRWGMVGMMEFLSG